MRRFLKSFLKAVASLYCWGDEMEFYSRPRKSIAETLNDDWAAVRDDFNKVVRGRDSKRR